MATIAPLIWVYIHDRIPSRDLKVMNFMYNKEFVDYLGEIGRCLIKAGYISVEGNKLNIEDESWLENFSKVLPIMIENKEFYKLII